MLHFTLERINKPTERGTLAYRSVDSFERYYLFNPRRKDPLPLRVAYDEGARITLYNQEDEHLGTYVHVPMLYFDLWDNYNMDAPERADAVRQVVETLATHDKVDVYFGYEGRTRHELAAHAFVAFMERHGMTEPFIFDISYNYHFRIARKRSLFTQPV